MVSFGYTHGRVGNDGRMSPAHGSLGVWGSQLPWFGFGPVGKPHVPRTALPASIGVLVGFDKEKQ